MTLRTPGVIVAPIHRKFHHVLCLNWELGTSASCVLYDVTDLETLELMRLKNQNALTTRSNFNAPPRSLSNALLTICRALAFVGICGTDLHEYSNPTFIPSKEHPHPVTGESMPVGFGHEFSGTVVEIGSKAQRVASRLVTMWQYSQQCAVPGVHRVSGTS
jgi:hypothetical protein